MEDALTRLIHGAHVAWVMGGEAAKSVWQNWGIAVLSIVVAVSLWVYVTDRQDERQTGRLPGSVPVECVNVPAGQAGAASCGDQTVTVRVRAPQSALDRLTADDCRASADVSGVSTQDELVPVRVECNRPRVEVVDWSPSQIRVTLENVASKTVAVRSQLVGAPPRGFDARQIVVLPQDAVVSGPDSLVRRVASVEADLDLTGVRADLEQTVLLKARDEQGADIRGVNLAPKSAQVVVTIVQLEYTAVFVVEPAVSGTPAAGFIASGIQIDPPFVAISGTAEVFQSLDPSLGVATEPISIDGATGDVVRTVALRLPQGARAAQPGVTVRVAITRIGAEAPAGGSP